MLEEYGCEALAALAVEHEASWQLSPQFVEGCLSAIHLRPTRLSLSRMLAWRRLLPPQAH
eukprot:6160366-Amphidinium_carterae.1